MKNLKIAMLIAGIMVALLALTTLAQRPAVANLLDTVQKSSAVEKINLKRDAYADASLLKVRSFQRR